MTLTHARIGVAPFGDVDRAALQGVAAFLRERLGMEAEILTALPDPAFAYDEKRGQYNAATILRACESMPFDEGLEKVIGILNVDLFIPIFTHVLGEAQEGGRFALASLYRLHREVRRPGGPQDRLLVERVVKVAVHELGHLFNMGHCLDGRCLMHYSGNLADLDDTWLAFCRYCYEFIAYAAGRRQRPRSEG